MFDNEDSIFGDDEGLFSDSDSVFGNERRDSSNPAIPLEADTRMHSPPAQVQNKGPDKTMMQRSPVALVAVFDEDSQPLVARTVMKEGKPVQLEEYRRPTPDEYNAIMFGGKIVRGGVVAQNVPTGTNTRAAMQKTPLGEIKEPWSKKKKALVFGVVGLSALGAGYGIYRWRKGKR